MVKKIIWALSSGLLAGGVSYFYGEMFEQQLFLFLVWSGQFLPH